MAKTLGYMITWTTYGTWLQGDERGCVKNGRICPGNKALMQSNKQLQLQDAIRLSSAQQQVVRKAIIEEAASRGQRIGKVVAFYKKAGRLALKTLGHNGKLWTRGYDKRFCFDEESLRRRIRYVDSQNPA